MKKTFLSVVALVLLFSNLANAQTEKTDNKMKALITYFSATGTTKAVAEKISEITNADIYEIKPEVPYTSADLDWHDKKSRSTIEMQDKNSRPAIADKDAKIENYDVIYVGFPIWWYVAPTIINTFLESYDFSGKTVILFATSGGSGFGKTVENLKGSCSPETIIKEGKVFSGRSTEADIESWVKSLKD